MLGDANLKNIHEVEGLRRSIAMLPAGADNRILTREEALRLVDALRQALREHPLDSI